MNPKIVQDSLQTVKNSADFFDHLTLIYKSRNNCKDVYNRENEYKVK